MPGSKVQWSPIPVGLGIAVVGAVQFYKVSSRDEKQLGDEERRPAKRPRIRPDGPWYTRPPSPTCFLG